MASLNETLPSVYTASKDLSLISHNEASKGDSKSVSALTTDANHSENVSDSGRSMDDDTTCMRIPDVGTETKRQAGKKKCRGNVCAVCGDRALSCNFGAVTCESCKAFFRRHALKVISSQCDRNCTITVQRRSHCRSCRLMKCYAVGMRSERILSEEQKLRRRQNLANNRSQRQQQQQQQQQQQLHAPSAFPQDSHLTRNSTYPIPPDLSHAISADFTGGQLGEFETGHQHNVTHAETNTCFSAQFHHSRGPIPTCHASENPYQYQHNFRVSLDSKNCSAASLAKRGNVDMSQLPANELPDTRSGTMCGVASVQQISDLGNSLVMTSGDPSSDPKRSDVSDTADYQSNKSDDATGMFSRNCSAAKSDIETKSNDSKEEDVNQLFVADIPASVMAALTPECARDLAEIRYAFHVSFNKPLRKELDDSPVLTEMVNMGQLTIRRLIKMAKNVPLFLGLRQGDQVTLLKQSVVDALILRSSKNFDPKINGWRILRDEKKQTVRADHMRDTNRSVSQYYEKYCQCVAAITRVSRRDAMLLMLLMVKSIFTTRGSEQLEDPEMVESVRCRFNEALRVYAEARYPNEGVAQAADDLLVYLQGHMNDVKDMVLSTNVDDLEPLIKEMFDIL